MNNFCFILMTIFDHGQYCEIFNYQAFFETKSYAKLQRLLRLAFPNLDVPDGKNIWSNVQKYVDHSTPWSHDVKDTDE